MEPNPQQQPDQGSPQIVRHEKKIFSRSFTEVTPLICAFCGGKSCKHENWQNHPNSAIKGLNSDWVTDNILATQRPSTRLIAEYNIIEQFKAKDIGAILNLQEPGEHPHCGDGIRYQSGFSYDPEDFYEHGIYFFNFGWRDMTATSTDLILKILKQMSFILTNGLKIAVHCHAGRGRTGLIIAAWLIYHENMTAKDAIKLVKQKRKDSISKKSQEKVLFELEKEIKVLRTVYFTAHKMGLEQHLYNQKKVMPLISSSEEKYVPKIILVALERMESLLMSNTCTAKQVMDSFYSLTDKDFFEKWESKHEKVLKSYKERINQGHFEFSEIDDPRYYAQLVLDFMDSFSTPTIGQRFIEAINKRLKADFKFTETSKEELFKEVDKKEFFLLEGFARFFSVVLDADPAIKASCSPVLSRLCLALLLGRQKHDKLFLKRNLIKLPDDDEKVTKLRAFISKWISSFQDDITESFIMPAHQENRDNSRRMSVVQLSKSKTLLTKTMQRLQSNDSNADGLEANKSTLSVSGVGHRKHDEDHKNNISHELGTDPNEAVVRLRKNSSNPSRNDLSRIEPIKEDQEDAFTEEDVFPEAQKKGFLDPKVPQNRDKNQRFTISVNNMEKTDSDSLFARPKQIKAVSMAISTPRLQELFTSVEELEGQEQEMLLQKLMDLKEKRQKGGL